MAKARSLSAVRRSLGPAAKCPHRERASSCCSCTGSAARSIDRSIEQVARTVPASAGNPVGTNSSSADRIRTDTDRLPLSPVVQIIFKIIFNLVMYRI